MSNFLITDLDDATIRLDEFINGMDFHKLMKKTYKCNLQYAKALTPALRKVGKNEVKTGLKNAQARERLRAKLEARKSRN